MLSHELGSLVDYKTQLGVDPVQKYQQCLIIFGHNNEGTKVRNINIAAQSYPLFTGLH